MTTCGGRPSTDHQSERQSTAEYRHHLSPPARTDIPKTLPGVARLKTTTRGETEPSGADYVSPTPPDTDASVDVGAIRQPHHFDLCYRTAKRAREAAEADPGNDPAEAPLAWIRR